MVSWSNSQGIHPRTHNQFHFQLTKKQCRLPLKAVITTRPTIALSNRKPNIADTKFPLWGRSVYERHVNASKSTCGVREKDTSAYGNRAKQVAGGEASVRLVHRRSSRKPAAGTQCERRDEGSSSQLHFCDLHRDSRILLPQKGP